MSLSRASLRFVQRDFSAIELSIGAVLIAIVAAVAASKYVDLSANAKLVALKGTADAITSASTRNHLVKTGTGGGQTVSDCHSAAALAHVPSEMTVTEGTTAPAPGLRGDCNINYITDPLHTPINFMVTGA